jgi:hypothetical protein
VRSAYPIRRQNPKEFLRARPSSQQIDSDLSCDEGLALSFFFEFRQQVIVRGDIEIRMD